MGTGSNIVNSHAYALGSWGVLQTEVDFPELEVLADGPASFRFRVENGTEWYTSPGEELQDWNLPDGQPWLRLTRSKSSCFFTFPDYVQFELLAAGEVVCRPRAHVLAPTYRHLFLDQVLPLLMAAKGETVLHGSAVAIQDKAVVFAGASGTGKSTVAAKLAIGGYPLITDDCLLVRFSSAVAEAYPSYPGVRLFSDVVDTVLGMPVRASAVAEYTSKQRIELNQTSIRMQESPVPIAALFVLSPARQDLSLRPIEDSEKVVELAKYRYRFDPSDEVALQREFSDVTQLAQLPLYELNYPRSTESLGAIEQCVVNVLNRNQ